jgi:hypothetical protein
MSRKFFAIRCSGLAIFPSLPGSQHAAWDSPLLEARAAAGLYRNMRRGQVPTIRRPSRRSRLEYMGLVDNEHETFQKEHDAVLLPTQSRQLSRIGGHAARCTVAPWETDRKKHISRWGWTWYFTN